MADKVDITGTRIEGDFVAFDVQFDGAPDSVGTSFVQIYDAAESLVKHIDHFTETVAEATMHLGPVKLPEGLPDGDYTAWVRADLATAATQGMPGTVLLEKHEGVTFLVARGRIFPSTEQAHYVDDATSVSIANLVLNGTWVVFDLKNDAAHDVSVDHAIQLFDVAGSITAYEASGRELVNAKATQQAHHLLPDLIADGTYSIYATAQVEGAGGIDFAEIRIMVTDNAITVVP